MIRLHRTAGLAAGALALAALLTSASPSADAAPRVRRRPPVARPAAPAPAPAPEPAPEPAPAKNEVVELTLEEVLAPATGGESAETTPASTASIEATTPGTQPDMFAPVVIRPPSRPMGWAGGSRVRKGNIPSSDDFAPIADRWRLGFPDYAVWQRGEPLDPYGQNVLKGDYPFAGQNTFVNISAISDTLFERRNLPTPTSPSTRLPESKPFFGDGNQEFFRQNVLLRTSFFGGNAAFKPFDWQLRVTPVFNLENRLSVSEVGQVLPDVRRGETRSRDDIAFEEAFVEARFADVSPNFDFISARVGRQPFISDFRGLIFNDFNRGARIFGSAESNRISYNLAYFDMLEKDINSELTTGKDRGQQVAVANVYRQDTFVPGYTTQLSVHYNRDEGRLKYDENGILRRPALIGTVDPTGGDPLEVWYFGWTGDGHIGRLNINHAVYAARGFQSFNPLANRQVEVDAHLAALEISEDRDWLRWKLSFLWSSGDDDPADDLATGFDSIVDNSNFAGGGFSFLSRQGLRLLGVELFSPNSLLPHMRSNKFQGSANFVNPGVRLIGIGGEYELTPKLRALLDVNHIRFNATQPIELFINQPAIHRDLGIDAGLGVQYRPLLNENVIFTAGANVLVPRAAFTDIFEKDEKPFSAFVAMTLTF